jgi:tetratricopeptide (TPR) repeat protein
MKAGRLVLRDLCATIAIVFTAPGAVLQAQPAAEHLRRADEAYMARNSEEAREHALRALAMDPANYEAHWKAARSEVDLAEVAGKSTNKMLLDAAEKHAQEAVRLRPGGADGRFTLARALRHRVLGAGMRDRARYAAAIRSEALAALAANPRHAGGLHVLGMWHAEVMRLNGLSRAIAKSFLGADLFEAANWDEAQMLLEDAARIDPGRIIHRVNLAGVYADRGDKARARAMYRSITSAPLVDPNDDLYKRQAAERLARLGN